jgi:hypothetical protein
LQDGSQGELLNRMKSITGDKAKEKGPVIA